MLTMMTMKMSLMTSAEVLVGLMGREDANTCLIQANLIPNEVAREKWLINLIKLLTKVDTDFVDNMVWDRLPVSPREFVVNPFYLGKESEIYPEVMHHFIEMNNGEYDEAVLTGGIGSGKTTLALYSNAYQLYRISCMANPQATFGLDSSSEIKMIFQSLRKSTATKVDFERFATMIKKSPYFNEVFPFDKNLTSVLKFPKRIEVEPVSGAETASIGQNIFGGIIDEINFMSIVENSKNSIDGGVYNQAVELYNSIARRRKTRFMQAGGTMPGLLCVVSSKRIPGEFTDKKMEEAITNPRIYVYDKRVWEIKPQAFCGETFRIFVGDESRRPKILDTNEKVSDTDLALIDHIPIEFSQEFSEDITKAIRDIAGHSTLATTPFLSNSELVLKCFGGTTNVSQEEFTDFVGYPCYLLPEVMDKSSHPRYVHIDLSVTGDMTGVVIGHVYGFKSKTEDRPEPLPLIKIDLVLEVRPPKGNEIEFSKIRDLLYKLRELGMPVKWVSLDSYQSRDMIQILKQKGFTTGMLSIDTSRAPYESLKNALYEGRLQIPTHKKLKKELLALEVDYKRNKIDHNAHNSKDLSDALAGVVYGLSTRREIYSEFNIPVMQQYSSSLIGQAPKLQDQTSNET